MSKRVIQLFVMLLTTIFFRIQAQSFSLEEKERLDLPRAIESYIIDMDKDGNEDILSASLSKKIVMWKGDGYFNFSPVIISENVDVARGIRGGDINGDGLNDIIIASFNNNAVKIYINKGDRFEEYVLDSDFISAHTPSLNDLDGDGDMDIVCSAFNTEPGADKLTWWENKGGMNFEKHTLSTTFNSATIVSTDDIDNDNDFDILVSSESLGEVVWWQNDGNGNFTQQIIDENFTYAHTAISTDLDKDGDKDIVGCSYETGNLYWWQNDGNQNFTRISIGTIQQALWINSSDLDDDGDNDLIATGGEGAFWFENDGSLNFTKNNLPGEATGGYYITACDPDGDTDPDIMAGSSVSGKIIVWRNTLFNIDVSAIPVSGHSPLNVKFYDESYGLGEAQSYEWDFDYDGTTDSYEQNPEWIYDASGSYDVKCRISFEKVSKTILKKAYINVFDGESSVEFESGKGYGTISSDEQLNLSGKFTVEFHFYPEDWGIDTYGSTLFDKDAIKVSLIGKGFGSLKSHGILLTIKNATGNQLKFSSSDSVYVLNRWQHLAITFDKLSSELKLYLNGAPEELHLINSGSLEEGLFYNADTPVMLGYDQNEQYGYTGSIDELRIWSLIRNEDDIAEYAKNYLNSNEPGLIAYFKMNEGNGEVLNDELGNYGGTLINAGFFNGVDFDQITGIENNADFISLPEKFSLTQNYPNPFNPTTNIKFRIPENGFVTLKIYDLIGREVATLLNEEKLSGNYEVKFNGSNLSSGVYFYRLTAGTFTTTKQMILLR